MAVYRNPSLPSAGFGDRRNVSGFHKKTWSMLYAERLKNLGRFSLYLNVDRIQNETGYSNIRVQVDTGSISITTGQGRGREWTWKLDIPDVQFHPASCRGLKCSSHGELQCTLQTTLPNLLQSPTRNVSAANKLQSHMVDSLTKCEDSCTCHSCGNVILPANRKFRRVLPLPSEAWMEMSGNHFCHQHEGAGRRSKSCSVSNGSLLPKVGDCLVGDLYFLVNSIDLDLSAIIARLDTGQVLCKRCRAELGSTVPSDGNSVDFDGNERFVCKIYSYTVNICDLTDIVGEPLSCINRWTFTEESYLASFLSEQSRLYTSYKFIIESCKSEDQPLITCLVWMLDVIQVYELSDIPTAAEHKHVHELSLEPELRQKILYQAEIKGFRKSVSTQRKVADEVMKLWKTDASVHLLTISPQLATTLLRHLMSSTNSLPLSCRKINEFHVGFLRPP